MREKQACFWVIAGWEQKGRRRYAVHQNETKTVMKKSRSAPLRIIKHWEQRWRRWRFNLWLEGLGPARDLLHSQHLPALVIQAPSLFLRTATRLCLHGTTPFWVPASGSSPVILRVFMIWGVLSLPAKWRKKNLHIVPLAAPFSAFGGLFQCFEIPNMKPVL